MANPFLYKKEVDTTYIDSPTTFTTWTDISDNSLDLAAKGNNEPAFDYGDANSKYRPHLTYDGSDDYCEKDSATILPITYPFALEAVTRTTSTSIGSVVSIVDKDADDEMFALRNAADGTAGIMARNIAYYEGYSTGLINDGDYHHVWAVYLSETDRRIYIDGSPDGTDADSVTMSANIDRVSVGRIGDTSPGGYFSGDVALARVWNRAPSASEISALSDSGDPLNYGAVATADLSSSRAEIYSQVSAFDHGDWAKGAEIAVAANTPETTEPDGGNTAEKITASGNSGTKFIRQTDDLDSTLRYRLSVYAKKSTFDRIGFRLNGGGTHTTFTFSTLAWTNVQSGISNYGYFALANDWYFIFVEGIPPDTSNLTGVALCSETGSENHVGSGVLYLWKASLKRIGCVAEWKLAHENAYSPFEFSKGRFIPVHEPLKARQVIGVAGGGQVKVADLGDAEETFPIRVLRVSETVKDNFEGFLADATVNYAQNTFHLVTEDAVETEVRHLGSDARPVLVDDPLVSGALYNLEIALRKEIS